MNQKQMHLNHYHHAVCYFTPRHRNGPVKSNHGGSWWRLNRATVEQGRIKTSINLQMKLLETFLYLTTNNEY